ncbi:fungal-specific transcription factor domain-containing protein [Achaetomium macrosporum]|uniref:Fungal-specific transcription factor domain-containing protein n=1 Tax=Achaetomium macrosporum TaxID=79813 RepID=A0AAN7CET1_9PEZI|nr:fungal-specific transcription factor domain-containing protein [Achaetomium macrosporum]
MPGASVAVMPSPAASAPTARKASLAPERKYKCQFCNRAFSRSEHRSRHERSHTKERPFKCMKCRSTFVRRDLLLRHDRTVHAKDGGVPLHSDGKRRGGPKTARPVSGPSKSIAIDTSALEQLEASSDAILDVEHAAMLITGFQHNTSAAAKGGHYDGTSSMGFSQDDSKMMEHSMTFSNAAIGLPQWDSFVDQPESKAHSTDSAASTSFGAQNPGHLAPLVGQNANAVPPGLQAMINSLPPSGAVTPTSQSPFPQQRANAQADASQPAAGFKAPQVSNDEERNVILDNIRSDDSEHAIPEGFRLPNLPSLNRFLATYFGLFHHHLPFLHPASFEPTRVSPALLLAVLSIGALYAFDQEHAYMLHIGSKVLVNQFLQNKENFSSRKCPLWTMQSSLLNMIFASWSGDPKGLEWACSIKSLLANMVAGNRYELKLRQEAREGRSPTRAEWIEDEGCRRTYYAVYIFFGLLTLTYNHTPAISFNEFEDLQLPSTEALWNLKVAENAWQDHLKISPVVTFMEAHDNLFQGEILKYSAFATRVMINALFLEVWYHKRSPEALQDVVTEYKLRLALETWEKSLDLCEPEAFAVPLSAPHKGHPLIFNAKAMFRNARARLEVDLKTVQEALRYHDSYEVAAAMSNARDRVKRSSEMLKVIQECYNCIETAVLQGVRWVARTSPTNWSIEHPLCGMDLMIILSLWLYRLEHDEEPATEEEQVMYHRVRQLFDKDLDETYVTHLSSVVARLWGSMLDEVVVWGITRLMGESFRLHSQALVGYVDDIAASSSVSTPSMTSQGADEDSVY